MILLTTIAQWFRTRLGAYPMLRRRGITLGILGVSVLASVSIFATGPSATPEVKTDKAWPVSVVEVTPAALAPSFVSFGRVESTQIAHLQSDLSVDIVAVHVREGQWVAKGDVLVELQDDSVGLRMREQQANLAEQRAALAALKINQRNAQAIDEHYRAMYDIALKKRARHEDLLAKRMIAQSLLDEVMQQVSEATIDYRNHQRELANYPNEIAAQMARIEHSDAELAQARIDVEHAIIRAPFAGPVLAVNASAGNHTLIGTTLVEMADADGFEIRAPIPDGYGERVRAALQSGAAITARLGDDDRTVALSRLSSSMRAGQSSLDAFFKLTADGGLPNIGRVVDLEVTLPAETNVVALPIQSIYENDRIYAVADDNRLRAITIERVGENRADDGSYRVLVRGAELLPGSRIITTQLPKAIGGLAVQPIAS